MKRRILIAIDWFDPAYKAGGPIKSCLNLVNAINDQYDIYVYTSNRDLGNEQLSDSLITDEWVSHPSGCRVWYSSESDESKLTIRKVFSEIEPDIIYLNSVFSKRYSIDILRVRQRSNFSAKVVLAVRGMLKPSALSVRAYKKRIFLRIAKVLGIYDGIYFHASTQEESAEIRSIFNHAQVYVAPNFPVSIAENPTFLAKESGSINIVFIGRIHPIKNLLFILELIQNLEVRICLTIIGNIEDRNYWDHCQAVIKNLSSLISVNYLGDIQPTDLPWEILKNHLLFLPTRGENYGHVIVETLSIGRPVLISDATPWKELCDNKAGWEFNLANPQLFKEALLNALNWEQSEFDNYCWNALKYASKYIQDNSLIQKYNIMFNDDVHSRH